MKRARCVATPSLLPGPEWGRPPEGWTPATPPSLTGVDTIRFDWETTGVRWWDGDVPVGAAVRVGDRSVYLPFAHRGGGNLDPAVVREWARRELRGKRIVNLNTKFEIHMARVFGVDLAAQGCTFGDVAHYAALLDDHRREFSLDAVARDFLPEGPEHRKVALPFGPEVIAEAPAWVVEPYACRDVDLVDAIARAQGPKLGRLNLAAVRRLEDAVIPVVAEMERHGAPLDWDKLERWIAETEQRYMRALFRLHRVTRGMNVDPGKDDDVARLFRHLGLPPPSHPEDGRTSYGAVPAIRASMATLDPSSGAHEALAALVEAKHLASLRSKYLLKYRDGRSRDGRLRYALHQLRNDENGTISGRFSCTGVDKKRREGANVQQVQSVGAQRRALGDEFLVRELFVPTPGRLWYASDAKQIEYREFADIAGIARLIAAYDADPELDYHQRTQEELVRFVPDVDRKRTKNTNFAIMFGAGIGKLAAMNGMTVEQAEAFRRVYDRAFPEVGPVIRDFMWRAEHDGFVTTRLGRRTTFPRGVDDRFHKAINAAVQGTAADDMKRKMVELYETRADHGLDMFFTVHDELDGDVPDLASAAKADAILAAQTHGGRVPLFWDGGTGANWREAKGE